ncbi:MAG TPA: HDOD domain-containing protein [Phycisphaerae bacterium]|nr:HDOD domain-containing protein [Phycisphaerales bacterium]HNO78549.1 HDOD domain-containing protein [Phycisphaerae bacterium]
MNSAKDIIECVGSIQPLPDTALKLMKIMSDPKSTLDEIVGTIKYDQAVTSEVLKLCNSAYFGLSRKVTSLEDALVCLGTAKVLQMVMSVHTNNMLAQEQQGYGLDPGILWKHSVAVALASSQFAQKLKLPDSNLAFTAGLLHDIGKVILNEHVAEEFVEIVRLVTDEHLAFVEAERRVLGFSHEEVGAMMAEKWKLPDPIVRCIRYHHAPSDLEPHDPLVDAIYLANCVCLLFGIGLGEDGLCSRADATVLERYKLRHADLEIIGAQVVVELQRVQAMFGESSSAEQAES